MSAVAQGSVMWRHGASLVLLGTMMLGTGCSAGTGTGPDAAPVTTTATPDTSPVTTLAKMDGWSEGFDIGNDFAALEIAFAAKTARQLWNQNVTKDLPVVEGPPIEPGVYGELADVDFGMYVVGLYSSGQSGSCPEWIEDIHLGPDGRVRITTATAGEGDCTADYNTYRAMVVFDRDEVPPRRSLNSASGVVNDHEALEVGISESTP